MMGPRQIAQAALFYEFSIEEYVPLDHLLRGIDRFVDLSDVRVLLAPYYSESGRPSIDPELMIHRLAGNCEANAEKGHAAPWLLHGYSVKATPV